MEAVKRPAVNGWEWIKLGFTLFRKAPLLWMILTSIGVVGLFAISLIPVIGDPLSTLLFPVLIAGFMYGCRAVEQKEELELAHLFAGFGQHTQHLVTLGGINLVGQLLILGVMMLTGGRALVGLFTSSDPVTDPAVVMHALQGGVFSLMLGVTLYFMLAMAMQFAPMLVIFNGAKPIPAMRASLRAFLSNWLPFTVYGLLIVPVAFIATLPMALGWLFLLPIMFTSMYVAYNDMFPPPAAESRTVEGEVLTREDENP